MLMDKYRSSTFVANTPHSLFSVVNAIVNVIILIVYNGVPLSFIVLHFSKNLLAVIHHTLLPQKNIPSCPLL